MSACMQYLTMVLPFPQTNKRGKQAGAELCQAQEKLGLVN